MSTRARAGGVAIAALTVVAPLSAIASVPAGADSPEIQVRAVLDGMNGSYNRRDFDGFAAHICAGMLRAAGFREGWYESRKLDGPTRITINSIRISGDGAVANVRFEAANHDDPKTLDIDFLREGAEWKAYRYRTGRHI
jgi:hypothetical protein